MTPTPIKVRGKKAGKQTIAPNNDGGSSSASLYPPIQAEPSNSPDSSQALVSHSPKEKPARKLSTLESLPVELLAIIFLYSFNINLPRASLVLGLSLSSFTVKARLVFKAFSSDGKKRMLFANELFGMLDTEKAIAKLQSDILASKWMNLTFLIDYLSMYLEKKFLKIFKELQTDCTLLQGMSSDKDIRDFTGLKDELNKTDGCHHIITQWRAWDMSTIILEMEPRDGLIRTAFEASENLGMGPIPLDEWRLLLSLEGCRIPPKMLCGPWTPENCEMLDIVLRTGASVDWVGSTSGEVAMQGLHTALLERNCRAVRSLTYGTRLDAPCSRILSPYEDSRRLCNVGVVPRTDHLRTAVIDLDCPVDLVECLLHARKVNFDFDDPTILTWAVQKKIEKDKRGDWLLQMMLDNGKVFRSYQQYVTTGAFHGLVRSRG